VSAKRHKVLLIAPTVDGEDVGESWVAYQWAKHLRDHHELTLLTYNKRTIRPASEQLDGMRVVEWQEPPLLGRAERFNSIVKPGYFPFYISARRWLKRALERGETFDVAHQPLPVAMRYPSPAAGLGIPLIIGPVGGGLATPQGFGGDRPKDPWFMKLRALDDVRWRWDRPLRRTYQSADCVLCIAPYVKEQLDKVAVRRFEVMSETGLESVPPPIGRLQRKGPIRLLYVGRLVRTKGALDIIKALASLPRRDAVLDIVGHGPDMDNCAALIKQLGLEDRVTLHGWKSKPEVAKFYQAADVFVFPSYREPGGNVSLEAMAHSLPLIVADRGGPGSAVSDDCAIKLGVTTPDAFVRDLAGAIETLCSDPTRREAMGRAAYAHVTRTALWSAKVENMNAIYADVIARAFSDRKRDRAIALSGR